MRADTKAVSIQAAPDKALKFLADPENLPRWAVGFAKAVRKDGERWVVVTGAGEMAIRIVSDERLRVVDFYMSPAPGVAALAASRGIANGRGAEYVFTQFQPPDMRDEMFSKNVEALAHELTVLK